MKRAKAAFTLIELLIVVAIIAVLAGIAVVNFSEAQTRSKVSAVRNDLRVLAGALESYHADHNKYPPSAGVGPAFNPFGDFAEPLRARLYALTTPVAYVSSIAHDVFRPREGWGSPDISTYDTYDYVDADAVPDRGFGLTSGAEWRLSSAGPDLYQAYGGRLASGDADANARGVDYDPTNGTSSWGDLVKTGPSCARYGDPFNSSNEKRPGIVRVPKYVEQWQ